jgi:hypothetical protein
MRTNAKSIYVTSLCTCWCVIHVYLLAKNTCLTEKHNVGNVVKKEPNTVNPAAPVLMKREARTACKHEAAQRKRQNAFRTICKHEDAAQTFFIRCPWPLVSPRIHSHLLQSISQLALDTHTKLRLYLRRADFEGDTQIQLFFWTFWFMKMTKEMTTIIMIPMVRYGQTKTVSNSYWSMMLIFFP